MSASEKHLVVIAGPTAIGKTNLCIVLALHFQTEIISADSRQFYRELSIGTAKPLEAEMRGVKHHFINNMSIASHYTVGQYEAEAISLLEELFKKHHLLFVCGGSGLFIDALCNGLDKFEDVDESVKVYVREQYATHGLNWLQEQIKLLDPLYALEVDLKNPQRLCRALEVCISSGKAFSSFRSGAIKKRNFTIHKFLLNDERDLLYQRINERVDIMMAKGLVEEVKSLLPYKLHNALNTVGYKEIFDFLAGKNSLEKSVALIKQNTRRYAKRQLTWFGKNNDYSTFHPSAYAEILDYIQRVTGLG